MFSPDIVCSDAFLDMPSSGRDLYFQLGMYADDDGFVNPRKIMRMIGSSEDDLKILIAKRFALSFPSGVLVVKHWKVNNLVRKDWYKPTQYVEEKESLLVKESGAYTEKYKVLVNDSLTNRSRRLGKVRLGKVREEINSPSGSISYLREIPKEDMDRITARFDVSEKQLMSKAEDLGLYCKSKGKIYKDYRAFLINAVKKDFKERSQKKDGEFVSGVGWVKNTA